ncbi:hypothetical protein THIOM_005476 [Candidatus Thiomargarita nelsonii]|uniref:Uncharacterized protein n=1 Tax=Candidatus Thiomargarita nelsonii TaxID=1003181 RepID=A0A176RT81_9GAMM|nr:hypothetical protein THIOM_005476 [Candidatus Thiomargarita nelsonii]
MNKANFGNVVGLWLLFVVLIVPRAESPEITVDVVSKEEFVIFIFKNYENLDFQCSLIRVKAKVKDRDDRIARREIIARNVVLPADSLEIRLEAGKEVINALRSEMNQPRIVDLSDPIYSCRPRGKESPQYSLGKEAGEREAKNKWTALNKDCAVEDDFSSFVSGRIEQIEITAEKVRSRLKDSSLEEYHSGYAEGLVKIRDQVMSHCFKECTAIGVASGQWLAKTFCRISEVIGRRYSVPIRLASISSDVCGHAYTIGCESKFVGVATGMCPSYAQGQAFERYYKAEYKGVCSHKETQK